MTYTEAEDEEYVSMDKYDEIFDRCEKLFTEYDELFYKYDGLIDRCNNLIHKYEASNNYEKLINKYKETVNLQKYGMDSLVYSAQAWHAVSVTAAAIDPLSKKAMESLNEANELLIHAIESLNKAIKSVSDDAE